jgi:hypothetical protein
MEGVEQPVCPEMLTTFLSLASGGFFFFPPDPERPGILYSSVTPSKSSTLRMTTVQAAVAAGGAGGAGVAAPAAPALSESVRS